MTETYRSLLKNSAMRAFFHKTPWVLNGEIQNKSALQRCIENEAARLAQMPCDIKFSLITPLYNTDSDHLRELGWSCLLQTYSNWEIILYDDGSPSKTHLAIAAELQASDNRFKFIAGSANKGISAARNEAIQHASGDFICVMDHDDLIHPQTLGIYYRLLKEKPETNFIFCNEVKISNDGTSLSDFYSKPGFSYATLLRTNYICHFTAVQKDLLLNAKNSAGQIFVPDYDGFEDHNLFVRLAETHNFSPRHTPTFGYYWRKAPTSTAANIGIKPDIWRRDRAMLLDHLKEHPADIAITRERGANELHSIHFKQPKSTHIAVVIPFKDCVDLTLRCIESLEAQEHETAFNVILVNNNSENPNTATRLESWLRNKHRHQYTLATHSGPFNYSAINNAAVRSHCGDAEFVLFLNNDVELSSTNAISVMAAEMQLNSKVAACGLKLNYPGNSGLQHGGMGLRLDPSKLYVPRHINGPREFTHDEHQVFAVTFACALVRKSVFDQLSGFDEVFFANGLSDVDLCCRIIKIGFEVFYFGTLTGIHHESATREHQAEDFEIQTLNERHANTLLASHLRQYGYDMIVPTDANGSWYDIPLRYKVADALNDKTKKLLGPIHKMAKKLLSND